MGVSKPRLEVSEAELIRRVCQGDKEAFYGLVRPYERAVYVAAVSILNNPADAEEVAQEAVLKALAHLAGFRAEAKFSTWLIQITINEARSRLRKDRRHLYESIDEPRTDEEGDYSPKDFADWREIPSEALKRDELRNALKRALATLPLKYREVLHPARHPKPEHRGNGRDSWHKRRERKNPAPARPIADAGCLGARDRRQLEQLVNRSTKRCGLGSD